MRVFQDLRLEQLDMHPVPEGPDEGVVRRAADGSDGGCQPGLATWPPWIRAAGLAARLVLPGVRTAGTAGGGRRELYAALDLRRIADGEVRWEGRDQGPIAPVAPPVRFGFGSTPAGPVVVRIVTLVRHRGRPGR